MRHRLDQVARIWAIAALVAWITLAALALGSTSTASAASNAPAEAVADQQSLHQRRDTPQTSVADVSSGVMCPSCDTTLDQSNSPAAASMRAWVEDAVAAGWTEQEIRDGLVEEYDGDESILATPRASGLGLVAWLVPLLVALVATIGGVVLIRRWLGQTRSGASSYSHASASPSISSSPNSSTDAPAPASSLPLSR